MQISSRKTRNSCLTAGWGAASPMRFTFDHGLRKKSFQCGARRFGELQAKQALSFLRNVIRKT